MKAITIRQPWASLIAQGHKSLETRTHPRLRSLVGDRVAIHAGLRFDGDAADTIRHACWLRDADLPCPYSQLLDPAAWPRACVVAVATATGLALLTAHNNDAALRWADGLWGLRLDDVQPLDPPIPAIGRQGIWHWIHPDSMNLASGD